MASTLHDQFREYESKSYDLGFWDGLGVAVGG